MAAPRSRDYTGRLAASASSRAESANRTRSWGASPVYRVAIAAVVVVALAARGNADDAELTVLGDEGGSLLYEHLLDVADEQFDAREQAVEQALGSPEKLRARRERLHADLLELVGAFPERTPLGGKTVGTIDCDGYQIEKVIFESRPGHHVTANLYLPDDRSKPLPGVLVPCGHSANGKASEAYQSACVLLALNGLAALIYDPIGQGERHQLPDTVRHGTTEHTLLGVGALLVGLNTGHYRIWDGLRSMDYLAGRPEVDPTRLGCTGNSGGGTMTTWLMAVDDRIAVAAPSCFVTTLERLFHTIGPQDCEQHFPGQGPLGIDHTDFITIRSPKPTIILAAEQDFFDFRGTERAYAEAAKVYQVLGRPEQVDLFSFDDKHGFSQPRREAAAGWMRRWLAGDEASVSEPTLALQQDADLQVTESGQVVQDFDDEVTVVDLINRRAGELAEQRKEAWQAMDDAARRATVKQVLGLPDEPAGEPLLREQSRTNRDSYTITKAVIEVDGQVPLPTLVCVPKDLASGEKLPAVIYADSSGKAAAMGEEGPIEKLVAAGNVVLAVDLRGFGETADDDQGSKYHNSEFRTAMLAMHNGQPLMGQRVADLLAVLQVARTLDAVDPNAIHLIGVGRAGPVALHAAALEPGFASVTVQGAIGSWTEDVVARPLGEELLGLAVPGALEHYDLPDLAAMLGDRFKREPAD